MPAVATLAPFRASTDGALWLVAKHEKTSRQHAQRLVIIFCSLPVLRLSKLFHAVYDPLDFLQKQVKAEVSALLQQFSSLPVKSD